MKKYKYEIVALAIFSSLFVMTMIFSHGLTRGVVIIALSLSAFFTIYSLPLINKKVWHKSAKRDAIWGAVLSVLAASFFVGISLKLVLFLVFGAISGYYADKWVKHVPMP
ncbi:hypothetical protein [Pleionea sp. CnH1-48]|uniref:hypothetical protein n=1 Tax=Pleionea sp. CnH1-48 TaxID=2954494 RepID=UPI0020978F24|nr:hypothetical protein [Pleionea sp. CnH1-48]MCO7223254.1 hypothetical protein [Pleionea sp. CnH1-48]